MANIMIPKTQPDSMEKEIKKKLKPYMELSQNIIDILKADVESLSKLNECNHSKDELVIEKNGDSFCMACVRECITQPLKEALSQARERIEDLERDNFNLLYCVGKDNVKLGEEISSLKKEIERLKVKP